MKSLSLSFFGAALCSLFTAVNPLHAQGTAFTYQGRLNSGTNAVNGSYDLTFSLFNVGSGGAPSAGPLTNSAIGVSNGLFRVTLDFGGVFSGTNYWLEIGVRTNSGGAFTTLGPRQAVTPAPYAIFAEGASAAGISGNIPTANLTGTYGSAVTFNNAANSFSGNGTGLTNVNAISLGGFGASSFWVLGGNAVTGGANLGNGDNQPLNLISWSSRVLKLETKKVSLGGFDSLIAVNTLGGASGNVISNGVMGGTIAGGGAVTNHLFGSDAAPNTVLDNFGTVGGGINNTAGYASTNFDDARSATVAGGEGNTAKGAYTTVSGGWLNTASGNFFTTVGGGILNEASGDYATVGGGGYNVSSGSGATVPGGYGNYATGTSSFAAGYLAQAVHDGTFVWADFDANGNAYYSTGTNQFCIRARGGIQVDPQTSMYFDSQTRQMLNLWGTQYGIGVQSATLYFRTDNAGANNGFAWFKGGTHNNGVADAGGGTTLMTLTSAGLIVNNTARIQGANNWDVTGGEGDFRVGNDVQRFKIGVATSGGGAGDVWMRAQGGTARVFIQTPGGTTFYSNEGKTAGVSLAAGGTAWAVISDRNVKKDFAAVDSVRILEKLAAMPITQWHYKWETSDVTPHIGPMAQDFKAAFYPGTDDKSITTQEADGVALAAIQGLNQKLNEKETEIAELKQRLNVLEKTIRNQKPN